MSDNLSSVEELRASDCRRVGGYIEVDNGRLGCAKCGHDFDPIDENYKRRLALREQNIEDLGRLWIPPEKLVDDEMTFREFYCPDCATRITTEVATEGDPIVTNMLLDVR